MYVITDQLWRISSFGWTENFVTKHFADFVLFFVSFVFKFFAIQQWKSNIMTVHTGKERVRISNCLRSLVN